MLWHPTNNSDSIIKVQKAKTASLAGLAVFAFSHFACLISIASQSEKKQGRLHLYYKF